jgi:HEAT repeat protein
MIRGKRLGSTLATLALCASSLLGQEPVRSLPAVEDPPELSSMQEQKLSRAVKKLRNSNAAKRAEVEQDVIAFGRGALPALLDASTTDHAGMMAGIQRCLVELVDARDRLLVEDHLESERVLLRRFAVEATGKLGVESLLDQLGPALADEDVDVATLGALSLALNGREDGLGRLVDTWVAAEAAGKVAAKSGSSRRGSKSAPEADLTRWQPPILDAVAGLRGHGTHAPLVERLKIDEAQEKKDPSAAAAVRLSAVALLHHLGDEAAVRGLAVALGDRHNLVQQAAINAVRELVEDKPPFQGATFQQIKELERLRKLMRTWRGFPDEDSRG